MIQHSWLNPSSVLGWFAINNNIIKYQNYSKINKCWCEKLPASVTGNAGIPEIIAAAGITIAEGKVLGISNPLIFNSIRCIAIANSLISNLPSASLSDKAL